MTDPPDARAPSAIVADLVSRVDERPSTQLASGHRLKTYRSQKTGQPVLGIGLPHVFPSDFEVTLLLRRLAWEGVQTQRGRVEPDDWCWVYIEPPGAATTT